MTGRWSVIAFSSSRPFDHLACPVVNKVPLSPAARDDFLKTLTYVRNQLWFPYHVVLEFQALLSDNEPLHSIPAYDALALVLDRLSKEFANKLNEHRDYLDPEIAGLEHRVKEFIDEIKALIKQRRQEQAEVIRSPELRTKLWNLIEGRVGQSYTYTQLEEFYDLIDHRYARKVPPGYMDADTKQGIEKYGDAIIWMQLTDFARENKKPIILVTNDEKADWWRISDGKRRGPRRELIREMRDKAGVGLLMYSVPDFAQAAEKYLGLSQREEVIKELERALRAEEEFDEDAWRLLKEAVETADYSHLFSSGSSQAGENQETASDAERAVAGAVSIGMALLLTLLIIGLISDPSKARDLLSRAEGPASGGRVESAAAKDLFSRIKASQHRPRSDDRGQPDHPTHGTHLTGDESGA